MTKDERLQKLVCIVAELAGADQADIGADATLESLGADSMDRVEIVMAAEEEFGIYIEDADSDEIVTFGDLVRLVEARVR